MSVSITAVALQGDAAFAVRGTTGVPMAAVRCQAFLGQDAAGPSALALAGSDDAWAATVTLSAAYDGGKEYRVVATCPTEDGADVTVPPFFG